MMATGPLDCHKPRLGFPRESLSANACHFSCKLLPQDQSGRVLVSQVACSPSHETSTASCHALEPRQRFRGM